MMQTIALTALLFALMGFVGENYTNTSGRYGISMFKGVSSEMAGDLMSAVNVCGTPGDCASGVVKPDDSTLVLNSSLFSTVTDADGDVAVWWNAPGGRYADVTNQAVVAGLQEEPAHGVLAPLGHVFEEGYWDPSSSYHLDTTYTLAAANFALPAPLVEAVQSSPTPPAPGAAMLVYSQSAAD